MGSLQGHRGGHVGRTPERGVKGGDRPSTSFPDVDPALPLDAPLCVVADPPCEGLGSTWKLNRSVTGRQVTSAHGVRFLCRVGIVTCNFTTKAEFAATLLSPHGEVFVG